MPCSSVATIVASPVVTVVVVDSRVPEAELLLTPLPADTGVILLNDGEDGLLQISRALKGVQGLVSLHLIGHGVPGGIWLGQGIINTAALAAAAPRLDAIGHALVEDGQVFLYGCCTGQGNAGRHFVQRLSQATGLRVAAASHPVGAALLGGSWLLDCGAVPGVVVATTLVVTPPALAQTWARTGWAHVLGNTAPSD